MFTTNRSQMPTPIEQQSAYEQHYKRRLDALDRLAEEVRKSRDVCWCLEHDYILDHIKIMRKRTVQERNTD